MTILRIECCQTAREVFQFANIARPAMLLHALERQGVELLRRQAVLLRECEEVADQIGQILDALTQRRRAQWRRR